MSRHDNARAAVLDPTRAYEHIDLGRADPPDGLVGVVDYLWWVTWHAPEPHMQEVIPRPVVHLVAERDPDGRPRLLVTGVQLTRFDRLLAGDGRAVALAFRPATFRPLLGSSVSAIRNRQASVESLFGLDDRPLAADLLETGRDPGGAAADLADWIAARAPDPDPVAADLAALVERAETDRSLIRAEHLATLAGIGLRTLQRQFVEYVGVGPKWVVQRCRLLDVAAAAHDDAPVDWAALAADLGYADQSHLIRAFTALVGRPPATYAAQAQRAAFS